MQTSIYHTLAPFVHKQWRWLCVCRFDPWREKTPFVSFIPEILIQVSICDFLKGLHVINGDQVAIKIHEFDPHLENKWVSGQN